MMGSNYRVNFEVMATTQGFDAGMNRINRGLTQIGGGFRRSGVDAGFMANQLKAVGTTARYYLAGRLVYGVQSAISNLGQFKTQLGEIDALATRVSAKGAITDISGQLNQLGRDALLMSNDFGASVGEVETYMQRFETAVGNKLSKLPQAAQREQITEFVRSHLNLVTMLGSRAGDPNELAGGLASMIKHMPGGDMRAGPNAKALSNYLGYILTNAPQLTGTNIAQAAGRLSSAQYLAKMSSVDVLGIYGAAAQSGGSPSVISRGITQMLGSSLMHPTKPESLAVYQQANLPTDPNKLAGLGGMNVFTKLMDYMVRSAPPGEKVNYDALYNVFSRQESVRQFANLLATGGVQGLKDFIKQLKEANKANYTAEAAKRRLGYSTLVRAQNAMTNLGIGLVAGADGPLELAGRGVIRASNFAAKHQTATEAIVDTSLGLYATNKLRSLGAFTGVGSKLSGLSRFGRAGRVLGGLGKFLGYAQSAESAAASQAIMAQEFPSVLAGGAADGSRGNPYWVIISPFSWQFNTPFSNLTNGPHAPSEGAKIFDKIKNAVKSPVGAGAEGATAGGLAEKFGARALLRGAGGPAAVAALVMSLNGDQGKTGYRFFGPHRDKLVNAYYNQIFGNPAGTKLPMDGRVHSIIGHALKGKLTSDQAEMLLQSGHGVRWFNKMQGHGPNGPLGPIGLSIFDQLAHAADSLKRVNIHVDGIAKMQLDLTTYDAQGNKVHIKKGVDAKLIPTRAHPSSQGKPGSRRGK